MEPQSRQQHRGGAMPQMKVVYFWIYTLISSCFSLLLHLSITLICQSFYFFQFTFCCSSVVMPYLHFILYSPFKHFSKDKPWSIICSRPCRNREWRFLCPTGRWFWLWGRDHPEPRPLANARTPAAAAVAPVVFTTLVTPVQTHSHTNRHTSQWGQKACQPHHPGHGQRPDISKEIFFIAISISFQCQRVLVHFLLDTFNSWDALILLSCTHFHLLL